MKFARRRHIAALAFVVMLGLGVVTTHSQAQTFTVLYNFTGTPDGYAPYAGLVQDQAGTLYGTTYVGGSGNCFDGCGTVFKVSKTGKETVLYNFAGGSGDGCNPSAELIRDTADNLYGTTQTCGSSNLGTVFKVSKIGKETVLHSFAGGSADGCTPAGGLLRDKAGNLYGATFQCGASGVGTVFRVSKSGNETVLHSFAGAPSDGSVPFFTSLLMDTKGNLYGVTYEGGASDNGVVYKLSKTGTLTLLYSFAGETSDGCFPNGNLATDNKGNLYGVTRECGPSGEGIVWKLGKKGTETVLHNFAGGSSDGAYPWAGVVLDAKGNFYGDTNEGGASGDGTVYELNGKGTLTLLHSFAFSDGETPQGGVIRDATGNLYGTGTYGGSGCGVEGCGTVWKLAP
jgi:uncharacterized repeat protein (TIGR03803 family)